MPLPNLESRDNSEPLASSPELELVHPPDLSAPASSLVSGVPKLRWALIFAVLGLLMFRWDLALIDTLSTVKLRGDVGRLVSYSEVFGHGVGAALFCLLAGLIDPRGTRVCLYLMAHALGSGLAADMLKLVYVRVRPHSAAGLIDHFTSALPQLHSPFDAPLAQQIHSFPSGHAATAAGLAIGLTHFYPRGAPLFVLFAGLAALQRVMSGAHYPSDCFIGIATALVACYFMNQRPLQLHEKLFGSRTPALRLAEQ